MKARRRIAIVTSELENIYQQRVMKGVFSQCEKYGYDVAVVAPMVETTHFLTDNLMGEMNIYKALNFDLFDGVIVTPSHMFGADRSETERELLDWFHKNCHCKVVTLDIPFGDYEMVATDESNDFYEIARHIYERHDKKNVLFLNGFPDYFVSEQRLAGFLRYTVEHGIDVPEESIIYGDFWYSSGEKLADEIISGEREMPDAVICASDHMAIGLTNRLVKGGIRVPEQIAVVGHDTTQEAAMNNIYVSSYEPREAETAARAVNSIRKAIEPGKCVYDVKIAGDISGLHGGDSCGCEPDVLYIRKQMDNALLRRKQNWTEIFEGMPVNISSLLESFMSEKLMSAADYMQCIDQIYRHVHLLNPLGEIWLCLKENWLDLHDVITQGYPEKMQVALHAEGGNERTARSVGFIREEGPFSFETKQMLPAMHEAHEPSAFYFSPIHDGREMYGYSVVRCPLSQKHLMGYVYHNWLRIVCSALSMTRVRHELITLSMKDSVTGLLNRRGMLNWLQKNKDGKENIYVIMADMDGLKYINDHYGHAEGDFSLITIAHTMQEFFGEEACCARIGGDEFMVVGLGQYLVEDVKKISSDLENAIAQKSEEIGRKYDISASIGYSYGKIDDSLDLDEMMETADMEMYRNKRRKKKERN